MLDELKEKVLHANLDLPKQGLVIFTWGNVSAIDRENNLIVIKPSGVDYNIMSKDDMVITDLDGNIVEGSLHPSSDLQTHIELYKNFAEINSIVHTHSIYSVAFSQARMDIPSLGTTHGDYFYGPIPCTREMTINEIKKDYERNTGKVIVEEFKRRNLNPLEMPGVLVCSHGPFTWGTNPMDAVHNSVILETIAKMASISLNLTTNIVSMKKELLDKHFLRKHGENAYYGQK